MRPLPLALTALVWAELAAAEEPEPCSVGFDYTISTDAASPNQSFHMYGNWGPEQLDRAPDFVTGGEMNGGRGRLEVVEWTPNRVQVRVAPKVRPGVYSVSMFCGEGLRFVSPFKTMTVLQPNPAFDYTLSPPSVRAGEILELTGPWKLQMDRKPILIYHDGELELDVVDWQDDVVRLQIPVFVDGEEIVGNRPIEAELYVDSEKHYLMAGFRNLEILPPTEETLRRARVDEGLVPPWIGESPKNLAIVAGGAFVLGSAVLGIGAMLAASADFAFAGAFLLVWIWPYTFGYLPFSESKLLLTMEFIVIHASAFLAALSMIDTTKKTKIAIVGGCCAFYTLMALGFSLASETMWPLVVFWLLMGTKLIPLFTRFGRDWDRSVILARAAVGTVAFVLAAFAGALLPLPSFGWPEGLSMGEGIAGEEPYRMMFMGTVYFGLMGIFEGLFVKYTKQAVVVIDLATRTEGPP